MKVYIYRINQHFGCAVLFNTYLNGVEEAVIGVGETSSFDLWPGNYTVRLKTFLPSEYPFILRLTTKIRPLKSEVVAIEVNKDNDAANMYFVSAYRSPSLGKALYRDLCWVFRWLQMKKKPSGLLVKEVDKEVFCTYRDGHGEKSDLFRKPPSPQAKHLMLSELFIGVLLIPFGIFVFNQTSDFTSSMGFVLFLAGTGPILKLGGYFSKSILVPSYHAMRFRCILNVAIFGVIAYNTLNQNAVFVPSILFLCVYLYIYFKSKTVFDQS